MMAFDDDVLRDRVDDDFVRGEVQELGDIAPAGLEVANNVADLGDFLIPDRIWVLNLV